MDKKDELLLLIAMSGEIPADWIGRAVGSESYAAALLTRLKRGGLVKLRSKDGVRGYLLRSKAKQYLLAHYREDVLLYLSAWYGSIFTGQGYGFLKVKNRNFSLFSI